MKRKLTLYSAIDVKKAMFSPVDVVLYDDKERAEGVSSRQGAGVYSYALNVAALNTLDLTEKEVPFAVKLAFVLSFKKPDFSSFAEKQVYEKIIKDNPFEIYHYDVIKCHSLNAFCFEIVNKYLLGEVDQETVEKIVFDKNNTEYLLKSVRARKRAKAIEREEVSLSAYTVLDRIEMKQRKTFSRCQK